ncbi:MAG: glycosyltransferase [Terrimicrobiaceae bacterium]
MKILFDHPSPFSLAHGGLQTQIEQTKEALEKEGVEVEWLRWWDVQQTGDAIHYFGRPQGSYIGHAKQKGMPVAIAELLTGLGSRPLHLRMVQRALMASAKKLLPRNFTSKMAWDSYQLADAVLALTPWERTLMIEMFGASPDRIHVVPNGVEEVFFNNPKSKIQNPKSPWLICTATITERKRVLELAEAAIAARTPVWIIGKPYSESDAYHQRFLEVVKSSDEIVRYEGGISDRARMAEIYQEARGFVLLSTMESLSLSALEAAAADCPLLLSDLPWARCTFEQKASYCPVAGATNTAPILRKFYDASPTLPVPPRPATWMEVAEQLKGIYEGILANGNTSQ